MNRKIHKLPEPQRKKLEAMIASDGLENTRKRLGISRHAMERAAGGLSVQRGTVAVIAMALEAASTSKPA